MVSSKADNLKASERKSQSNQEASVFNNQQTVGHCYHSTDTSVPNQCLGYF
jgi:hypothetical protein